MAVMIDLYSTLVHERPDNPFYSVVPQGLRVDRPAWLKAHRSLGAASMAGALPDMAARVAAGCRLIGCPRDEDAVRTVVTAAMEDFYASVTLDPAALALLAALRDCGQRVAIVSNASSYSEAVIARFGLDMACDDVILSCQVGAMKPDAAIYLAAAKALDSSLALSTFIGDGGDSELQGAKSVGMSTVLIDRDLPHTAAARQWADHVLIDLLDAIPVVTGPN